VKKGTIRNLLATSILACTAAVSQAAVESWDYEISMSWDTGATKFYGVGKETNNPTYIGWGYGKSDPRYHPSYISITKSKASGNMKVGDPVNSANEYVQFTHYNGSSDAYDRGLKTAVLDVSVQLTLPGTTNVIADLSQTFELRYLGGAECSSVLGIDPSGINFKQTFDYGDMRYEVNFYEAFQFKPIDERLCINLQLGKSCVGFITAPRTSSSASFRISITAVPEPETYAMVLAGLGLIGAVARRRKGR